MANVYMNGKVIDTLESQVVGYVSQETYMDTYRISNYDLQKKLKHRIVRPVFKLYILNDDETIKRDVSNYLLSGSLSINFQNGQRRNLNVTLANYDGVWNPSPYRGWLWHKTKFRLDLGVIADNTIYWRRQGIFVVTNPNRAYKGADNTISLSLVDKFGLFDGTVSGTQEWYCKVPVDTSIREAISGCINGGYANGEIYDLKPLIMDSEYQDELVAYTLSQNPNSKISDTLLPLAEMISCDMYYNEYGNMVVEHGIDEVAAVSREILWQFNEGNKELHNISITNNWSEVKNRIVVVGAVVNGDIMSSTVELVNPTNKYCTSSFGTQVGVIEDTNIYSEKLARDRGIYELQQSLRKAETISFETSFIPHADVGKLISINSESLDIPNGFYFVKSVDIPISTEGKVSWSVSSIQEGNNVLQEISR